MFIFVRTYKLKQLFMNVLKHSSVGVWWDEITNDFGSCVVAWLSEPDKFLSVSCELDVMYISDTFPFYLS